MIDTADMLIELCSLPGPPGFEEPVAHRVRELLESCMDEAWIDVLGNVIGVRRCGKEGARKLLLDAHIDETGFIMLGAEEGFLRFGALGTPDVRLLPTSGVTILSNPPRYGVVCAVPPHLQKKGDAEKYEKLEDMFIDVGLTQEEAVKCIPPGTPAVLSGSARRFGDNAICGRALDDRAGIATILSAMNKLGDCALDVDLYVMASVQEEVGARGAAPGVFEIEPDCCIVIDAGHAKTPDSKPTEADAELGGGVMISRGPNMNAAFTERLIDLASKNDISFQIDVEPGGDSGTNARVIQISRGGVATALLSFPTKYMHSAHEVASLEDIDSAAKLLKEAVKAGDIW